MSQKTVTITLIGITALAIVGMVTCIMLTIWTGDKRWSETAYVSLVLTAASGLGAWFAGSE